MRGRGNSYRRLLLLQDVRIVQNWRRIRKKRKRRSAKKEVVGE